MSSQKQILFSGIQPSGEIHIGNYLGMLKQSVDIQHDYISVFSIVDLHSITQDYDPKEKREQIIRAAVDVLACGIDGDKSILFIQSHVKEHAELAWILNCITPVSELERMTQFKEKAVRQEKNINMGLFDYPVLMAADILIYKAGVVPVGEDQVQHVELTRLVARKFNHRFGQYFVEPKARLTKVARVMSLTEPNVKMSKSLGPKSYIALFDSPDVIEKKIKSAVSGDQGGKNLVDLFEQFSGDEKLIEKFKTELKSGEIKYSELKSVLTEVVVEKLKPIQQKREVLLKDKGEVEKILQKGANKAREIAEVNMKEIKEKVGLV